MHANPPKPPITAVTIAPIGTGHPTIYGCKLVDIDAMTDDWRSVRMEQVTEIDGKPVPERDALIPVNITTHEITIL
ncbi:hypothetical protein [Nesterenkonia suensis]